MALDLLFDPLIPLSWLVAAGLGACAISALGIWRRAKGTLLRTLTYGAILLVLSGPMLSKEERTSLSDVVAVVVDRSQSQEIGARTQTTDEAVAHIKRQLDRPDIEYRLLEAGTNLDVDGTHLFDTVNGALKDVPPDRLGAIMLITDGQVHDVPPPDALPETPIHTFLTGEKGERDRKLTIVEAPPFGIVGQDAVFTVRVDDLGATQSSEGVAAFLTVSVDGRRAAQVPVPVGVDRTLSFRIGHGGSTIVELEVNEGPHELTLQNNRAVFETSGVRDRLRVLLVSGEPHAGERTWRNLLKADPSVDLVHFTILRPPEKQDDTPHQELALISFPVRELFAEKLYDFDLIIFDRYRRREVIAPQYFHFMTDYVEQGGAILVAAGPDFSSPYSIAGTSLVSILPALPTRRIIEKPYLPKVSKEGLRHPVTAGLTGANSATEDPNWGRWFRLVETETSSGRTLMTGADDQPLLVLDSAGRGRVATLMSDHVWLWARGFEGGGPQAELLRRLAHWLMKEPDLEEELLSAAIDGRRLTVTRRTMADEAAPIELTFPSGRKVTVPLSETETAEFVGEAEIDEVGLYRLTDGTLSTLTAAGPLNPLESSDMRTDPEKLLPLTEASGGGVYWIGSESGAKDLPLLRRTRPGRVASGSSWFGVRENESYLVESSERTGLIPPILALAVLITGLLLTWRREGE